MPERTIRIIDQLAEAGMPDPAFQALHHRGTAMGNMRHYCVTLKNGFRSDDTNDQFKQRLEIALRLVHTSPPMEAMDWYRMVAEALRQNPLKKSA